MQIEKTFQSQDIMWSRLNCLCARYSLHSEYVVCNLFFALWRFFGSSDWPPACFDLGLPWWVSGKESAWNAGDLTSIPGSGKFPEEQNGNPLQYSCLRNPMDRGAWWAIVHMVAKSWTQLKWLSTHAHTLKQGGGPLTSGCTHVCEAKI